MYNWVRLWFKGNGGSSFPFFKTSVMTILEKLQAASRERHREKPREFYFKPVPPPKEVKSGRPKKEKIIKPKKIKKKDAIRVKKKKAVKIIKETKRKWETIKKQRPTFVHKVIFHPHPKEKIQVLEEDTFVEKAKFIRPPAVYDNRKGDSLRDEFDL